MEMTLYRVSCQILKPPKDFRKNMNRSLTSLAEYEALQNTSQNEGFIQEEYSLRL